MGIGLTGILLVGGLLLAVVVVIIGVMAVNNRK